MPRCYLWLVLIHDHTERDVPLFNLIRPRRSLQLINKWNSGERGEGSYYSIFHIDLLPLPACSYVFKFRLWVFRTSAVYVARSWWRLRWDEGIASAIFRVPSGLLHCCLILLLTRPILGSLLLPPHVFCRSAGSITRSADKVYSINSLYKLSSNYHASRTTRTDVGLKQKPDHAGFYQNGVTRSQIHQSAELGCLQTGCALSSRWYFYRSPWYRFQFSNSASQLESE